MNLCWTFIIYDLQKFPNYFEIANINFPSQFQSNISLQTFLQIRLGFFKACLSKEEVKIEFISLMQNYYWVQTKKSILINLNVCVSLLDISCACKSLSPRRKKSPIDINIWLSIIAIYVCTSGIWIIPCFDFRKLNPILQWITYLQICLRLLWCVVCMVILIPSLEV